MEIWRAFIVTFLCVGTLVSNAQNTFSRAYENEGYNLANDISIVNDGYYIVGSGSYSYTNLISSIKIMKVDTLGIPIWEKQYGTATSYRIVGLPGAATMDENGNVYFAGSYADTVEPEHFLIGKLDENGDSIWFKTEKDGLGSNYLYGISYDSISHQIYATGASVSEDETSSKAVVWVLDTSGNTISLQYYSWTDFDYGRSIVRVGDTVYISGYSYIPSGKKVEPCLVKLDTLGNLVSQFYYGTNNNDFYASLDYRNGKFLLQTNLDTIGPAYGATSTSLLDSYGNVLWKRVSTSYGLIYQSKLLADMSVVSIGATRENTYIGAITKLDSIGNVIWDRSYSFNDPNLSGIYSLCNFYDFEVDTASGSIIIVGTSQRDPALGDSTGQDFWLLKLDSMGCLVPGCDTITEVGMQPIETSGPQVTVYPNPAKYTARVLLNHGSPNAEIDFTLFGLSGQAIITQKHLLNPYGFGEWTIDLAGLPPGLYLYRITSGGKAVNGKLLVE